MDQNAIYEFDKFRLDTSSQILWCCNTQKKLTPKAYRLLLYFLQHPLRLLSHEELFAAVWDGRIVDDSALRLAVNGLRNVLNDDIKSPRYILTVCKRGYRFLASVKLIGRNNLIEPNPNSILFRYYPHTQQDPIKTKYTTELTSLLKAFNRSSTGERRLVFLQGVQGIGKTALINKFLNHIDHPGLAVLHANCVQLDGAFEPFMPLLEAIEIRCRKPLGDKLIACLHQIAPSWLYQMLNVLNPDQLDTLHAKVPHTSTGRMLREGAEFIESIGAGSPFILILDNCHWCDECTLDLLNFLAHRGSATQLLMIVSYRPDKYNQSVDRLEKMRKELDHRGLSLDLLLA